MTDFTIQIIGRNSSDSNLKNQDSIELSPTDRSSDLFPTAKSSDLLSSDLTQSSNLLTDLPQQSSKIEDVSNLNTQNESVSITIPQKSDDEMKYRKIDCKSCYSERCTVLSFIFIFLIIALLVIIGLFGIIACNNLTGHCQFGHNNSSDETVIANYVGTIMYNSTKSKINTTIVSNIYTHDNKKCTLNYYYNDYEKALKKNSSIPASTIITDNYDHHDGTCNLNTTMRYFTGILAIIFCIIIFIFIACLIIMILYRNVGCLCYFKN